MVTILFVAICIIFMGLGLPDSVLNSAWPAIYAELNLPFSYANFITVLVSLGTVLSSLFAAKLIAKFGVGKVTFVSTLFSALCLFAFSFSNSMLFFCLLSIPLGLGAGAIDTALNNYTATNYSSLHMSLLHCFYGVGISISPFLMSFALGDDNNWRKGYVLVFIAMMVITLISFISLPLWKKVKSKQPEKDVPQKTLSIKQMFCMPAVRSSVITFFCSVGLEFTCGIWACTYLVNVKNLSEALASRYLTFYYAGITIGRLISGFVSKKLNVEKIVYGGYSIVLMALVLLFIPLPPIFKALSLFFVGFGNGPTFPNLIYLTPKNFGSDVSQSIIGLQMATCNLGILILPPVFGFLAQELSLNIFPIFLGLLYIFMVISTIIYSKQTYPLRKSLELKENKKL
ncbi:MAG: MFS transporter [Clostridiales bacterium]|nr:MFS transporter [Clostridiales bacterium]